VLKVALSGKHYYQFEQAFEIAKNLNCLPSRKSDFSHRLLSLSVLLDIFHSFIERTLVRSCVA
jgi:hypothetical protein